MPALVRPCRSGRCGCADVSRHCEARRTSLAAVQRRRAARARHKWRADRRRRAGRRRRRRRSPPPAQRLAGRRRGRRAAAAVAAAAAAVAAGRAVRGQRGAGLLPRGARGGRGLGGRRRLGGRLRGAPAALSGRRAPHETGAAAFAQPDQSPTISPVRQRSRLSLSTPAQLDPGCAWMEGARRPWALG